MTRSQINAWPIARIGAMIAGGDENAFLPFPIQSQHKIPKRVARTFLKLRSAGHLPREVLQAFSPLEEEIQAAAQ